MRDDWGIVRGMVLLAVLLPGTVAAQLIQGIPESRVGPTVASGDRVPEGVYVMPWIATGVLYDDNVFFSVNGRRQDDVFLRVTPGLQASYQSSPFTIVGNYRFDSEVYHKHTEINSAQQRQFGTIDMRARPSSNLTLANTAGYAQTRTPFELNLLTSVQVSRFRTERYFENPSAEYRLDPLNRLTGSYVYSKDLFSGLEINTNIFNAAFERRVGQHDTLGSAYLGRHFSFGGNVQAFTLGNAEPTTTHALQVVWGHEFSADTRLDVRIGPRLVNGSLDGRPEAFVAIRQRIQGGELSLGYTSAVTTLIGTAGTTRLDSLILGGSYQPAKQVIVTVGTSGAWISSTTFSTNVYTAFVETAYQFNKYVAVKGSAFFSYQEGNFRPTGGAAANDIIIGRNVYWLRLEFTYPTRWE